MGIQSPYFKQEQGMQIEWNPFSYQSVVGISAIHYHSNVYTLQFLATRGNSLAKQKFPAKAPINSGASKTGHICSETLKGIPGKSLLQSHIGQKNRSNGSPGKSAAESVGNVLQVGLGSTRFRSHIADGSYVGFR